MNDSNYSKFSLFKVIILIIFVISFCNFLQTGFTQGYTFKSLLDVFTDVPHVDVSWSYVDFTIYNDWGIWNHFRDFFNLFIPVIEFWIFLVGALWQGINVIFYFLQSLFSFAVTVVPGAGPSFGGR